MLRVLFDDPKISSLFIDERLEDVGAPPGRGHDEAKPEQRVNGRIFGQSRHHILDPAPVTIVECPCKGQEDLKVLTRKPDKDLRCCSC